MYIRIKTNTALNSGQRLFKVLYAPGSVGEQPKRKILYTLKQFRIQ